MVLEQIFKEQWLERRPRHAFLLAITYTLIGITSAKLVFGGTPGLMTVAFTAILLIPSLNTLLSREENVEVREKKFSLVGIFRDHKDIFEIYFFLFMGIFITYVVITSVFPVATVKHLFGPQMETIGVVGNAFNVDIFSKILINNVIVLLVCLILSFMYGAGAIIFLTWNASVWGVAFGYAIKTGVATGGSPLVVAFATLVPILPHLITEAVSYFSASIVGGVVSKAVIREKVFSKKFHHIVTDALVLLALGFILVIVAAALEVYIFI